MSNNKLIMRNTAYLYFRMLLVMVVSIFTSRIILKNLGETNYGLYGVIAGIISMFTFLNGSLAGASSRYITVELAKGDFKQLNKVFSTSFAIHLALAIIVVILSETVGLWFLHNKMVIPADRMYASEWVFQLSILSCFFSITQVPYGAIIVAHENMKIFAYTAIVDVLFKLLLAYSLSVSPIDKLIFHAVLLCAMSVGMNLFYRIYCIRKYKEARVIFHKDWKQYKDMFSYTGADMIGNLSVLAQGQGLNMLLNTFFGSIVNAARSIAFQVQGAITQFSGNFFAAVRPQIIKLYTIGNIKDMLKLVYRSSCFSYYLMWIISLPICLEAKYILTLWLGEFPEHTVSFLILTIILCLIQTIKSPRSTIYHAAGKLKFVNLVVGSILCMAFPIAYICLKLGASPESSFYAAIFTMAVSEVASIFILKRYIEYSAMDYALNVHGRCLLVTAISLIISVVLHDKFMEPSFVRLICTGAITTISIAITVMTLGVNNADRKLIINTVKSKIIRK